MIAFVVQGRASSITAAKSAVADAASNRARYGAAFRRRRAVVLLLVRCGKVPAFRVHTFHIQRFVYALHQEGKRVTVLREAEL